MNTVTEAATKDDFWQRLAHGILEDHLPGPTTVRASSLDASIELDDHTDMFTHVNWWGAGPVGREQWRNLDTVTHYFWSEVAWHGWTVRIQRYVHEPVRSVR